MQVCEACSVPACAGHGHVVLGGADREAVCLLPRWRVQPGHAGPVGQPAAARPVFEAETDAFFHARDDVPARLQDRGDQVIAREVPVEADDAAGEQARAALHKPLQQGLLPGPCLAQDRPGRRAARASGHRDDPQLRERGGIIRRPGASRRTPGSPWCPPGSPASRPPRAPSCPATRTADGSSSPMSGPAACQNRSSSRAGGTGSRQSVTTFPVGTCHSRANGMSASSPARRASASQYEASGSGGIGAPCQDCSWWVSPILPPHPACGSHRTGRSMCLGRWISRMARLMAGGRGWGSASRGSGSGLPARSPRR